MRSQEFTGKTTQEAIDAGLAAFGVTIADVHVDVLQEGAKGLFGLFGSKPARVRMTVMEEEREDDHGLSDLLGSFSLNEQQPQRKKKPAAPKQEAPKAEAKAEQKAEVKGEAKPEVKKEAPKKEAPKAEKKAEPKPEKKAEAKTEAKTEAKAEEKAEAAAEKRAEAKEKRERKPRPKKKTEAKPAQETEKKDYQPMEQAQPFNPTEPPVMHAEDTIAGCAQRFLMEVTDRMGVKVDVYVDDSREDNLYIHMVGDTLGILIGRRGETLDALQYLTSLQVN
ncbi:MAG: Jag N-terminal domain-containing protein, partial [Clostridia bacterium]|nr:Jag N-terminal domain-containing protein [Clostridia bacterium]